MKTSEQIASMLHDYGVTHFFFVPVILPETLKRMPALGITPVMTHGEKAAAYMADGYARVSGRVGVVGAQAIGSSNLAAGLRDPYMARVPIVALSGAPNSRNRYRNLYQDIDDRGAYDTVTKWHAEVPDESRFPDLLRQAFRAATSGMSRPVHLALAGRTGNPGDTEAAGDGRAEPRYGSGPSSRPQAEPVSVVQALDVLAGAQRPVILAGNGVARSGAEDALLALARDAGVPVVTSLNAIATIPHDDPLHGGVVGEYGADFANRILLAADAVLVVGSSLGSMTTRSWTLIGPDTAVVQVDIHGEEIGRTVEVAVPLEGDARSVLTQLAEAGGFKAPAAWLERAQQLKAEWLAEVRPGETSDATPIRPDRLLVLATEHAADDAIFVGDTGHIGAWAARHAKLRAGQTMIRAAGSLGWGLPAAVGAQCAAPGREVICLTGDAGVYWHIAELETAKRYGLNIIVVINNNSAMNQEATFWDTGAADQVKNWVFEDVDFAAVARGFGCHGATVTDPTEFPGALAAARASGLPAVLDVRTDVDVVAPVSHGPTLP
jgi:acetolactate synthase-1/2/3 large subunit